MADWDAWFRSRPQLEPKQEQTAHILHTLHAIAATARFEWGLTGGTALQSYFADNNRRYSNDVEIITRVTKDQVETWMAKQGWKHEALLGNVIKAALPQGTLYVFHDYTAEGYEAAGVSRQEFHHYPLPAHPPPERLRIPLLAYDFLMAAKVYGVQETRRGGERTKDAQDLCAGIAVANVAVLLEKLDAYLRIKGSNAGSRETIRAAGTWIQHYRTRALNQFVKWRAKWVVDTSAFDEKVALDKVFQSLQQLHGAPILANPNETRRFLLEDLPLNRLGKVATKLGYPGRVSMETQKLFDFFADVVFPKMSREIPKDGAQLLADLEAMTSAPNP